MPKLVWGDKQRKMLQMPYNHTLDVLEGTPRSGKTTAAVSRFAWFVWNSPENAQNFLVLGYSQEQAYRLVIDCDGLGLMHIFPSLCKMSHNDLGDHLEIETPRGKKFVYYKGGGKADSYKSFQGMSIEAVFFCEINLLDLGTIQEAFRRTYAAKNRWHIADLNPCSPNDPIIDNIFNKIDMNWTHWTVDDNPIITPERKQELYNELIKNEYLFKRDWLGQRVIPEGVIYSMFDKDKHFLPSFPANVRPVEMFFSADAGSTHATSVGCYIIGQKEGKYLLYKVGEWFYDGETMAISLQAKDVAEKFAPYMRNKYGMRETTWKVDPAAKSFRQELELYGIPADKADNNGKDIKGSTKGIKVGIENLQNSIADGRFFLVDAGHADYNHRGFLMEVGLYVVDKHGEPVQLHDDSCDATRYAHNYYYKNYVR